MEEKTNKFKEINKSLRENQAKTIKQAKQTLQDLKSEIEAIKKTWTEGIMVHERELTEK